MNTKTKISRNRAFNIFLYIFFFLMCACFVLPLIVVISASFTSEQALTSGGFSLLPRDFTLDAYKSAFSSGTRVLRAYGVTIFQAVVGTVLSSLVAALAAYPLSRSNFRYRRPITVFIFFTMLFSEGRYADRIQPHGHVIALIRYALAVCAARAHHNGCFGAVAEIRSEIRLKRIRRAAVRHGLVP